MVERAIEVACHVVLISPPPIAEETRLTSLRKKNPEATLDRSMETVLPYSRAVNEIAQRHPEVSLLELYAMGDAMGQEDWAGMQCEDGLHLSPAGQRFVSEKLLSQLVAMGVDREAFQEDYPWGHAIDPEDPEGSIRRHVQACHVPVS